MRIAEAEVIPYALRFREPYATARGRLDRRELVLFRLTSTDGVVGLGETTSLSLRGGRALAAIVGELEEVGRRLVALPSAECPQPPRDSVGSGGLSAEARCACSMAVTDLATRLAGRPFAGAAEPVPCNATLSAGPASEVAKAALRWGEQGFRAFKLKVGAGEDVDGAGREPIGPAVAEVVEQVGAVRSALGPEAKIRIDANGVWSVETAVAALAALESIGVELCEQPVATLEEMAQVRAATSVPLAADESVAEPADASRARELGACDLLTLKLAKVGGHGAALGGGWGLPIYVSSALEGPVGIAAAGHVAAELDRRAIAGGRAIAHGLATQLLFAETIAVRGPEVREGMLHLPGGPGLGVEIDEEALERLRLPG